ncbi:MAG: HIT family protein [Chlorobi bacterium]|nr:HIT family protein [Chlorobiota bacterium]
MSTVFTKIINREIPAYIVAEDDKHIAFLDIFPVAEGHVLAVPKKEIDKIFDMEEDEYLELMRFARKVAKAMERVFDVNRIGMAVIGLEVPHVHVHLVPINTMADMDFSKKKSFTPEQFEAVRQKIARAWQELYGNE